MPRDPETGMMEADIIINGRLLTFAESLTLRVAIGNFRIMLADQHFRQGVGEPLALNYAAHIHAIERTILERCS